MAEVLEGTVVRFDEGKGYGFVSPDEGGDDVFLHVNELTFDKTRLSLGARVAFAVESGDRGAKATGVRFLGAGDRVGERAPRGHSSGGPGADRSGGRDNHLCGELTEALLDRCPDLRAEQVVEIRRLVLDLVRSHGWSD